MLSQKDTVSDANCLSQMTFPAFETPLRKAVVLPNRSSTEMTSSVPCFFVKLESHVLSHGCYQTCVPLLQKVVPSCQRAVDKCENTFVALIRSNSYSTSFEATSILCAEARAVFTVTYVQNCVLYKGNRAGQSQVIDPAEQRYIEVGAKTEKEGQGKMNNSLTVGMKQPVRVLGVVWYRRVL